MGLDKFVETISESITDTQTEIKLSTPNIAALVLKVNKSKPLKLDIIGSEGSDITLDQEYQSSQGNSSTSASSKGTIIIPPTTFDTNGFDGKVRAMVFNRETLFQSNDTSQEIESVVISVSLGDKEVRGNPAIVLEFQRRTEEQVVCSYWKEVESGKQ